MNLESEFILNRYTIPSHSPMSDRPLSFMDLLKQDHRYPKEAYIFVFESLDYAQNTLKLGHNLPSEPLPEELKFLEEMDEEDEENDCDEDEEDESGEGDHNHITGQDLCHAAKDFAILQYGALAKTVLNSIGIKTTGDIGEIVYNMIRIGRMRKTPDDSREDFDDVFDFETVFQEKYRITEE